MQHRKLEAIIQSVKRRKSQGVNTTEVALPIETLEEAIVQLDEARIRHHQVQLDDAGNVVVKDEPQ